MVATIDEADMPLISGHKWTCFPMGSTFYAVRGAGGRNVYMHRLIMSVPRGLEVDHIDGNGLNNQRSNLRIATRSQNMANTGPRGGSSRFKGVSFHKRAAKWQAYITVENHRHYLGLHGDEVSAAQAYDIAAREAFGEFAKLNIPERAAA